jgi:hypothetical protein
MLEIPILKDMLLRMELQRPQLALQGEDMLLSRNTEFSKAFCFKLQL